jgi:hypothetical protein
LSAIALPHFFFFNGNTFGEIARRITDAIFIEFPLAMRQSARIAHERSPIVH